MFKDGSDVLRHYNFEVLFWMSENINDGQDMISSDAKFFLAKTAN